MKTTIEKAIILSQILGNVSMGKLQNKRKVSFILLVMELTKAAKEAEEMKTELSKQTKPAGLSVEAGEEISKEEESAWNASFVPLYTEYLHRELDTKNNVLLSMEEVTDLSDGLTAGMAAFLMENLSDHVL